MIACYGLTWVFCAIDMHCPIKGRMSAVATDVQYSSIYLHDCVHCSVCFGTTKVEALQTMTMAVLVTLSMFILARTVLGLSCFGCDG
jgi:hypothetical protein